MRSMVLCIWSRSVTEGSWDTKWSVICKILYIDGPLFIEEILSFNFVRAVQNSDLMSTII
jgi:hypothetical protein